MRTDGLRPDIQALRALAVLSVISYHLWPSTVTGGYVGVDVFFAISGFLITSHLLSEIDRTGRLRVGSFWARRIKRLMPASTLLLVTTLVAVVVVVPRALWHQFLREIMASSLQIENWRLAHDAVDYLGAENTPSPVQHFWTLSAEEQLYVGLPLLMVLALALTKSRRGVLAGLALVTAASFAYSVHLTSTSPGTAYFSTFTRAWEFGVGGLLAYAGARRSKLGGAVSWLGVGAVLVSCLAFDKHTAVPGYSVALPVTGALAVLFLGDCTTLAAVGRLAPVALLGRVSYAAYLWHWPLIVLLPYATGRPLDVTDRVSLLLATVLIAWASTSFVEDPIRFKPRLLGSRPPRVIATFGATALVLVVGLAGLADADQGRQDDALKRRTAALVQQAPPCFGVVALTTTCSNPALDGTLVPDPATALADDANRAECWGVHDDGTPKVCTLGPASGYRKHLLAAGDSHNNALIGVYRGIAERNHWRIDVAGRGGCYLTTLPQVQLTAEDDHICTRWRHDITRLAETGGYDAIVVTHSAKDRPVLPPKGESLAHATVRGLVDAWQELPAVPILAIVDNPSMVAGYKDCVTAHREDCARPRSEALGIPDGQREAAAQVSRVRLIDLSDLYCTPVSCSPVIGHVLVYRDPSHVSATYAQTLIPYADERVRAALS